MLPVYVEEAHAKEETSYMGCERHDVTLVELEFTYDVAKGTMVAM